MTQRTRRVGIGVHLLLALFTLLGAAELRAQTTTGMIRGRVLNEGGAPVSGAQVLLRNTETGALRSTLTQDNGTYALVGVPPGTYDLSVDMIGYSAQPQAVRVLIGQSLAADIRLQTQAVRLEGITAASERLVETRTSEIATNVTDEQMSALPQPDRNFLNFAGLAPGITVSRDETNKQITAGALPATKINVFIDGASFKNDVLEGGVHGQDASRGNPFPQIALQEFRVITQNFKAEYQRAASAIVTATTKSGTNELEVSGFILGQNKSLVEENPGLEERCETERTPTNPSPGSCSATVLKPQYERLQMGLSVGGPIIRDRFHYFAAYENNIQNRESTVTLGRGDEFRTQFGQYEGTFNSPFRSHLGVAKLTYQLASNQSLNLSWNGRFETDERGFGGQRSYEAAENVKIRYNVLNLQHGMTSGSWYNQAQVSAQRSTWNPTVLNETSAIEQEFMGVIIIGARNTEQRFTQDRLAFRNDLSHHGVNWNGAHLFKGGINVDFLNYDVQKRLFGTPTFFYDVNRSLTAPAFARWGSGNPGMDESNVQFGAYLQDDWDVSRRLQLNLGVRWDAETNMFNNKWVTPDSIRTALGPILTATGRDPEDYFTRGSEDRPMFLGAFQPRLGFSFDVTGSGATVVHGGFGVYYDREIWNHLIDERTRLDWVIRFFDFTSTGEAGRIPWNDAYLSPQGLQGLVDAAGGGINPGITSEVWLLQNDSKPPRSNQWNLGLRQTAAGMVFGAAYRGVRGENLTSWYCAKAHSVHGFCEGTQELGSRYKVLLSTDEGESKYDALDLTAERPYTDASRWGFTFAYTMAEGERKGWDFFTFDFLDDPESWPFVNAPLEKHRISASGIVGLPWDFRLSTLVQWGSGVPFSKVDELMEWGPRRAVIDWYSQDAPNFRQVDLRLQKSFMLPGQGQVGLIAEAINVFDHANYRGFRTLYRVFDPNNLTQGRLISEFGTPDLGSADPGRRLQLGLDFRF